MKGKECAKYHHKSFEANTINKSQQQVLSQNLTLLLLLLVVRLLLIVIPPFWFFPKLQIEKNNVRQNRVHLQIKSFYS